MWCSSETSPAQKQPSWLNGARASGAPPHPTPFTIYSNPPALKLAAVSPVLRAIYGANTDLCICISFKRPSTTSTNDARKPQPPSQCSKPGPQPRFEAIPGVSILSREELQKSLPVEEDLILVLPANVQKSVQTIYLTGVTLRIQIYKY